MENDTHFNKLFYFGCALVGFGLLYMLALTFLPIPKDNVRFADTSIGWVQGSIVTAIIAYFYGGNAQGKKKVPTEEK